MNQIKMIAISICCLFALVAADSLPVVSSIDDREVPQRGQGVQTTERRIALVIGNAAYTVGAPLGNPLNDARDMADVLRRLGFEVISGENLSQQVMEDKIRQFGGKLRQGGVGLFYYAGHGMQVDGTNYLIPVDADIRSKTEVKYKTVDAGLVLGLMEEANNRLNIVILDACRDNPFRSFARSSSGGLAVITPALGQIYISYATTANSTAADGAGRNGLFTGELLQQINQPGITLQGVFMKVRAGVKHKSGGKQVPFEYSSIVEEFYFVPAAGNSTDGKTPPSSTVATIIPAEPITGSDQSVRSAFKKVFYDRPSEIPVLNGISIGVWIGGSLSSQNLVQLDELSKYLSTLSNNHSTVTRGISAVSTSNTQYIESIKSVAKEAGSNCKILSDSNLLLEDKSVDVIYLIGFLNNDFSQDPFLKGRQQKMPSDQALEIAVGRATAAYKDCYIAADRGVWTPWPEIRTLSGRETAIKATRKYNRVVWAGNIQGNYLNDVEYQLIGRYTTGRIIRK